ncbi:MAG: hypothetical protein ABJP48_07805 [Erythrobacter sp.]
MKKRYVGLIGLLLVGFAIFGWNPFAADRDTSGVLAQGYAGFETGSERQANGVYKVRALTRMPGVKAEMVRWWFADYMQTTEHYKMWHPTAHIWMDWENKTPGEIIGAAHLVHETIGPDPTVHKLRIQFVEPTDYLLDWEDGPGKVAICARAGALEEPMNFSTLCHIVRDTEFGAEMRSVFWMGHVSKRDGNENIFSIEGLAANTWLARRLLIRQEFADNLMTHAIEEMGTLSDFLPELHAAETALAAPDEAQPSAQGAS